ALAQVLLPPAPDVRRAPQPLEADGEEVAGLPEDELDLPDHGPLLGGQLAPAAARRGLLRLEPLALPLDELALDVALLGGQLVHADGPEGPAGQELLDD